ncbi:MAG: DUF4038 domain-containing protein [Clostridia bacterium]|nr:DUF4038 domain-containing protein [Clostridia bacterium]
MRTKKLLAIVLCFSLLFSCFILRGAAADGDGNQVPAVIHTFEKVTGLFVSIFAKQWNRLTGKDETVIPSAVVADPSWVSCDENFVIENAELTAAAQTWVMQEFVFESEKTYADPFNDVNMDVNLYGNGRMYTLPAFWDGGNVWKVRLVCPSAGTWYFETACTDTQNTALHNRTGKIECTEYDGEYDIYKHGFVTTQAGEKYFTYDDGTPFFWLGDTHWSLGGESADMVTSICTQRVSQGFTVIQSEPIDEKFDFSNGITEDDMEGLHRYDEKFGIIAQHGLTHANAQFFFPYSMKVLINNFGGVTEHGDMSDTVKAYLEKISRYWVARYGAYPVVWTLGQEVDNDFYWNDTTHPDWNYANNPYKLVAEYIAKYDTYDHPLTAHQENTGATACYGNGKQTTDTGKVFLKNTDPSCFRDVEEHDFYAAQWNPSKTNQNDFDVEKDYWYNSQGKPAINYEGQYCYLWTKNFGARMQGWLAFLNGMYGYGWGGHDTWSYLNVFDEENDSSDGVDTITSEEKINATWEDSLEYESSYQVGYMRNFLATTQWQNLIPRFDNKSYFVRATNVYYAYASNADNTEIVIYFYSFTDDSVAEKTNTKGHGGIKTGTVGNLTPDAEYSYTWFDPISGEIAEEGTFTANCLGTYYLGERPQATDMALLIRAK